MDMDDLIVKLVEAKVLADNADRPDFMAALEILIQTASMGLTITDMDLIAGSPLDTALTNLPELEDEQWRWS